MSFSSAEVIRECESDPPPTAAVVVPRARDFSNMFYRDQAVELSPCPFTHAQRFARGQHYVLERFRENSGTRAGLTLGQTIVKRRARPAPQPADAPKRHGGRVHAHSEDTMAEKNAFWVRKSMMRDHKNCLWVIAHCTGPCCTGPVMPARVRRFAAGEWLRRQTSCSGCATHRKRLERNDARELALAEKSKRKREQRMLDGICQACPAKLEDLSFHKCRKCRDRANDAQKKHRTQPSMITAAMVESAMRARP